MENLTQSFLERYTMWFSSYKNCELKLKLWWVGARERKKRAYFVTVVLSEGNFFNISVLSQFILYWINFQNIYNFTYQKTLFHTLLLLVFKMSKAFSVSLKLTSHDILHYLESADLSKSFSQLIVSIFTFLNQ